ncbi:unnamed protein product [Merluccius merluccius]
MTPRGAASRPGWKPGRAERVRPHDSGGSPGPRLTWGRAHLGPGLAHLGVHLGPSLAHLGLGSPGAHLGAGLLHTND